MRIVLYRITGDLHSVALQGNQFGTISVGVRGRDRYTQQLNGVRWYVSGWFTREIFNFGDES